MNENVNIVFVADANPISIQIKNIEKGREVKFKIENALLKHYGDKDLYILARNESKTKEIINAIIQEQKSVLPQIQRLSNYFKELEENEHFVYLKGNEFSLQFFNQLYVGLFALKNKQNPSSVIEEVFSYFKPVFENYVTQTFDKTSKIRIGEPDKKKRICRFCGEMMPAVNFKKKAHSISESFGNKVIICNEECDDCNEKFGNTIEQDFSKYFEVYRVLYEIEGKNGIPKIKGKNFEFKFEGNEFVLDYQKDGKDDEIILQSYGTVCPQNVYKSLCKFFLGIIEREYLEPFDKTIQWINSNFFTTEIPKLIMGQDQNLFTPHPKISYYLSRTYNNDLPVATCELRTKDLIFLYIIPTFDGIETFKYNEYFKLFKHYSKVNNWKQIDLNSGELLPLKHKISMTNSA